MTAAPDGGAHESYESHVISYGQEKPHKLLTSYVFPFDYKSSVSPLCSLGTVNIKTFNIYTPNLYNTRNTFLL